MSQLVKNTRGIMGLILSQLGLIVATGILLDAVFSLIFQNDWYEKADLKNVATDFSTIVEGMDTRFFENKTTYWFPHKNYQYSVMTSTEFIIISIKGNWDEELSHKERYLRRPWPRTTNPKWTSGEELHEYLKAKFFHTGNESDPIQSANIDDVKNDLNADRDLANTTLALNALKFDPDKPTYIEKIYIHFDKDDDGWDKTVDEKLDFIIIYQI